MRQLCLKIFGQNCFLLYDMETVKYVEHASIYPGHRGTAACSSCDGPRGGVHPGYSYLRPLSKETRVPTQAQGEHAGFTR